MSRRLWTGVGALVLGGTMLVAAQLAGASSGLRQGGIFRVASSGASVQLDPQLAYVSTAWWLEYATALELFNYPDRRGDAGALLRPEAAASYRVSRDAKTWTFTIRRGLRFSDGSPVTAQSFRYALDRAANHDLASPAAPFITDPGGTNIVGATAVNDGDAVHVRGVTAKGRRLVIRLTRPSPVLPTLLAMPFFQATSTALPLRHEVLGAYPSAGPYFFAGGVAGSPTELRRNPYYRGARPRNLAGVDVTWNVGEEEGYQQVRSGALDEAPLPAAHVQEVAAAFGVNRTRFWSKPTSCVGMIAFNGDRPLLRNNLALRRAINLALDRRALAAAAGPYAASPWSRLLPATFAGTKAQPYGFAPQLRRARRLAAGHRRSGAVTIGYRSTGSGGAQQAGSLRATLVALGIDRGRIRLKAFSGADLYDAMGKRNSDLDFGAALGWCVDSFRPEFVLQQLLGPWSPLAYDRPAFRRRLAAALRLGGIARLRALARLDFELMRDVAPAAPVRTYDNRYFFSARVDPRSLVYENAYSDWSIPALALK